jgi:hypothetical protein
MRPDSALPKRLPLRRVRVGSCLMRIYAPRIHTPPRNALWFGPAPGRLPIHRFDDPDGRFRVCYLATTVEVCFAETFLRNPPVRILSLEDLGRRSIATVEVRRELRLVPIQGPGLVRLGVTAELASGGDYGYSQLWSRALWEHPNKPDGILYRSRHDDSALCAAVFNRAKNSLAVIRDESLTKDTQQLARLLKRYGVVLTS